MLALKEEVLGPPRRSEGREVLGQQRVGRGLSGPLGGGAIPRMEARFGHGFMVVDGGTRPNMAKARVPRPGSRLQRVANGGVVVASPTESDSNRLIAWVQEMAWLLLVIGGVAGARYRGGGRGC